MSSSLQAGDPPLPGPPYRPTSQALGQVPSVLPDVPINAAFLFFFVLAGAGHMFLLKYNGRHGKKFIINGMIFGFCMTRVFATTFRMVWATQPHNVQIAMAAIIFVHTGVILLFIANLFFTQRVVRAQHPYFGWSKPCSVILPILLFVIVGTILSLIAGSILEFYSLNSSVALTVRHIKLYASTIYAIVAFIPIPIVTISTLALRYKTTRTFDGFGEGSMMAKVIIIVISAVFLTLGAAYRSGTTWLSPNPIPAGGLSMSIEGPWYLSRGYFYAFNFGIELFIVWFWLVIRIDKRFIIPDGAKGPYSYSSGLLFTIETGNEKPQLGNSESKHHLTSPQTQMSEFSSQRDSRVSWTTNDDSHHLSYRNSKGAASRGTWDVTSCEDVAEDSGEDYDDVLMYYQDEEMSQGDRDFDVESLEQKASCEINSGKWALRPVSGLLVCYLR